ncbi:MAG: cyclic nucleotide-binding domain-containing protein [Bacteroidetes bacterium]|nr:cyclic nucleotide-binding domain-containing protein [Bacteroidota bacterium]
MEDVNNKTVHSSFWTNIFNYPTEKSDLQISLQSIPLFESLGKRDLSLILNIIHSRSYLTGEYIFYQGDPGIGLYVIREGKVRIIRSDEEGNEIELAIFSKGDFFGELAMIDGEKRSASAVAKSDVRAAVIFKPDLDEFIEKYPKKGINILYGISKIIATRLRLLNEDFFSIQSKNK